MFSLIGNPESPEIVLDGIIVRVGAGSVYAVDADYLVEVMVNDAAQTARPMG